MEAVQLATATDVLGLARKVLDDPTSPYTEVRYAGLRLAECLTDVLSVAESRGSPACTGNRGDHGRRGHRRHQGHWGFRRPRTRPGQRPARFQALRNSLCGNRWKD
ncbi:hypothetical protein GCM10010244_34610 [Streptomyces coeruleorubidus]|nr:hypothetical protein GCM10010244_34610 [Streptomyces bellus]